MRALLISVLIVGPAMAESPVVRIVNVSRPASSDFQIGDRKDDDFGGWRETWTVGGKLAQPAIEFSVEASCLPDRQAIASISGPNTFLTCETTHGRQTFQTPSSSDSFRTSQTLRLLWHLTEWIDQPDLKQQIANTVVYLEAATIN